MSKAGGIIIAIDAMGGDRAPRSVIEGLNIALKKSSNQVSFRIYGHQGKINTFLDKFPKLKEVSTVVHTEDKVPADMPPAQALRTQKNSSMRLAINAIKEGDAQGVVSCGNTGAYVGMAKFVLGTLKGIKRPAIAALCPTKYDDHDIIMLDLGANVEAEAGHMVRFALMGKVYAQNILGYENPSIGLLNNGTEEIKGHDYIRDAAAQLKGKLNYVGFVEGHSIFERKADVVVADGFTGNVMLKSIEGSFNLIRSNLKKAFTRNLFTKLGFMMIYPIIKGFKNRFNPARYNGAMFLGINGVVIKSHGGASPEAFAYAVGVAENLLARRFNDNIEKEVADFFGSEQE